ncbi:MAG TPA: hypothetical protein VLA34_00010, partial [Candidatus Krumholzibacterium sp.]|nr:hypothetical protein [Candidatus Krumholzibacterium sp.]
GDAPDLWMYDWSLAAGLALSPLEKLSLDLEGSYTSFDGKMPASLEGTSTFETILRGDYGLTAKLSAIFDIRIIRYVIPDTEEDIEETFIAPFAGFEYRPMHKVRLTLAYGIDPLDFTIDYEGRRTGRWNFMNTYLWDNPGGTLLDAEQALEDRKAIVLRALFNF